MRRAGDALAYELVGYEPHMPALLARATRRGVPGRRRHRRRAHGRGLPAVLVPLPGAPSDHQARNARDARPMRARRSSSPDAECDAARLDAVVSELLAAPGSPRRDGGCGARGSAGPTPPRGSPTSSRSTPR